MLTLKSLTFQNIGRFVEPQTINFENLGSLVQIEGQNNCTGGSSGAGKSTIFKAINWLLGLDGPSTTVLQSRLTKDSIQVSATFDYDGLPLVIERGKKLLITLNGETTTGSSKLTEEKLDSILGMNRDLFSRILHKKQGSPGFFLEMGPSDVHRFLTDCLSLQKEQAKIVTLDMHLLELEKRYNLNFNAKESFSAGLYAARESIIILGSPPTLEVDPEAIQTLRFTYNEIVNQRHSVESIQKMEMADLELSRPKIESIPFDRSQIVQTENEIGTLLAQITTLEKVEIERQSQVKGYISELQIAIGNLENLERNRKSENQRIIYKLESDRSAYLSDIKQGDRAMEDAKILMEDLKKIRAALCPTCDQSWITESVKAKELQILEKIKLCKNAVILGKEAKDKIHSYNNEIERLKLENQTQPRIITEIQAFNEQIAQLKIDSQPQVIPQVLELKLQIGFKNSGLIILRQEERDHQVRNSAAQQLILVNFASKQTELRKNHEIFLKHVQNEESSALTNLQAAEYKIKAYEGAKTRFEEALSKLKVQEEKYSTSLNSATLDVQRIQEEIELATESKKVIKSYLSCSFEDALESIGDMATRLIRNIPNMSTATIQFEGLKETGTGKIKEEVNCSISMDGEIGIPVKSLSGGERSSTDLAIDLSVIKFIEERTGKGSNLYIMDEPFQFLDSTNIEQILEMIKGLDTSKTIILVDHNEIVKEMVGEKITVIRDGEKSRIAYGENI